MEAGKRGPTGDTGRVGDTGRTGDTGAEGGKGTPGDTGAAGQKGDQGPRNSRGLLVLLAVTAVVVLVVVSVFSTVTLVQGDKIDGNAATIKDVRHSTGQVIVARCGSENELRQELRELVNASRDNLEAYRERGLLTPTEYRETVADQDAALEKLRAVPCGQVRARFLRSSD